jgi:hypothetical protein
MRNFIFFLILSAQAVFSQNSAVITYNFYSNSAPAGIPPLVLMCNKYFSYYINSSSEKYFIDYTENKSYQTYVLKNGNIITVSENLDSYPIPEIINKNLTADTMTILGFLCRKANVTIRSNHIEIWFTEQLPYRGTPAVNIGAKLGLVLKIVRNNNFIIQAENISFSNNEISLPNNFGQLISLPYYRYLVTSENYKTLNIFQNEIINYDNYINNPEFGKANITYRFSKGNIILKKISLPDSMGSNLVFAELCEKSRGDAYDRTGSCFIIPESTASNFTTYIDAFNDGLDKLPVYQSNSNNIYRGLNLTQNYVPPIELIRFITPFGIGHFNSQVQVYSIQWEDSVIYSQDITDLLPVLKGDVWFGVYIGCYDSGGHNVSLNLKFFPENIPHIQAASPDDWIKPIIFTPNLMESESQPYSDIFLYDTLSVKVNIPEGLKSLKLRFISTGHGGWENGDEFNKKLNSIFLDGKLIYSFIPWRDDCRTYRKYNPASGNFPNGLSSSDYSRSGWCPGAAAVPIDIIINDLSPGEKTFSVFIPMGKPEGSSFSSWNVSAVLIGKF